MVEQSDKCPLLGIRSSWFDRTCFAVRAGDFPFDNGTRVHLRSYWYSYCPVFPRTSGGLGRRERRDGNGVPAKAALPVKPHSEIPELYAFWRGS